jgi:predicted permease
LRPGATLEGLNGELDLIVKRNAERLGDAATFIEVTGFTGRARSMREFAVGDLKPMLLLLQAIVLAVLLIACANIANLQLARIASRRKELSIRAVLGARRTRLAALVLAESLALSALGAVAGVGLALGGLELVRVLGLDQARQGFEFAMDARVIGFTAGAALLAALISALLPIAVLWRERLAEAIHEAGRLGGGGRAAQGLRSTLVVVQIAMSVALLVGAGLLTRSFYELQDAGPGFEVENILTARVGLPQNRYGDSEARAQFYERAIDELRQLPGVTRVGLTSILPFSGSNSQSTLAIDGYSPPDGVAPPHAQVRSINEDYLPALDIPVVQGRNFRAREPDRVVIIDQNMARRYWPEDNALGQRLRRSFEPDDRWYTVVGVVPAIKQGSLTEDPTKETAYWHYLQLPDVVGMFTLRTGLAPEQFARVANDAVLRIDPELPLFDVKALDTRVMESLGPQRTPMVLTLVFAAVAFTLAVVGVYGVLNWAVTQRFGEIGVRMALGAGSAEIVRLIVGQGGRLTAIGMAAGIAAAIALGRYMSSEIYEVSPLDPLVFSVVIAGLGGAALLASWLPARRAARIDPMAALRKE